jgi:hypothetical protein
VVQWAVGDTVARLAVAVVELAVDDIAVEWAVDDIVVVWVVGDIVVEWVVGVVVEFDVEQLLFVVANTHWLVLLE